LTTVSELQELRCVTLGLNYGSDDVLIGPTAPPTQPELDDPVDEFVAALCWAVGRRPHVRKNECNSSPCYLGAERRCFSHSATSAAERHLARTHTQWQGMGRN